MTVCFDRGGWSPALFADITGAGFDVLTWRKGPASDIPAGQFTTITCADDRGRQHRYDLADTAVTLTISDGPRKGQAVPLRQVTRRVPARGGRTRQIHALPPTAGLASSRPGLHGPLAPAPLQGLPSYYGPFRPCASRYSAPHGVRRLGSSLSRPAGITGWPSVSRRQVLQFRTSACDELTPPLHRAPPGPRAGSSLAEGPPAGAPLSQGRVPILSFDAI